MLVSEEDGKPKVMRKLPIPGGFDKVEFKEGDIFTALNETQIASFDKFFEAFEKIEAGKSLSLTFERDGKAQTVKFEKPSAPGNIMIKTR